MRENVKIRKMQIWFILCTSWPSYARFSIRSLYVSWYKCLIVSLGFSHLGFWSGNLFLIAPFPDLCLLVPLYLFIDVSVYTTSHVISMNFTLKKIGRT